MSREFNEYDKRKWALEAALETRRLEIELFWRRASFFWGFQIALIAVLGFSLSSLGASNAMNVLLLTIAVVSCFLGCLASWLGYLSARGSKYWQEVWERRIEELEPTGLFGTKVVIPEGVFSAGKFSVSKTATVFVFATWLAWSTVALVLTCVILLGAVRSVVDIGAAVIFGLSGFFVLTCGLSQMVRTNDDRVGLEGERRERPLFKSLRETPTPSDESRDP